MDPLKMYFPLKMVIFHCYVSLPEGIQKKPLPTPPLPFQTKYCDLVLLGTVTQHVQNANPPQKCKNNF